MPKPLLARIQKHIEVTESGCWLWTGYVNKWGYGRITSEKGVRQAYRVIYEGLVGPVPKGLALDHVCHNEDLTCAGGPSCLHRRCVNPAHLVVTTVSENLRRGRPGQCQQNALKTHCKRGHEFTPENTARTTAGGRRCRTCAKARKAKAA